VCVRDDVTDSYKKKKEKETAQERKAEPALCGLLGAFLVLPYEINDMV